MAEPIVLRLKQSTAGENHHRVEVEVERDDGTRRSAPAVEFAFEVTEKEQGDLRWYFEDYLDHPHDPAP